MSAVGLVEFKYDALGRIFEKKYREQVTNFVWDGNTPLHEWQEAKNSPLGAGGEPITWIFDADSFVPSAKLVGDKSYSIVSDYLGTPCQAYSETGAKVWEYEQKSYGGVETLQGAINFIPFRFQGQYEDVETGLYYNRFRYYSPEEGSYISQDPIRLDSGEMNFYSYVHNTNYWVDVLGLGPVLAGNASDPSAPRAGKDVTVYENGMIKESIKKCGAVVMLRLSFLEFPYLGRV